jgi:hypothetical protein
MRFFPGTAFERLNGGDPAGVKVFRKTLGKSSSLEIE